MVSVVFMLLGVLDVVAGLLLFFLTNGDIVGIITQTWVHPVAIILILKGVYSFITSLA